MYLIFLIAKKSFFLIVKQVFFWYPSPQTPPSPLLFSIWHFFEHHGGGAAAAPPPPPHPPATLDFLQRFNCTPIGIITSSNIIPATFWIFISSTRQLLFRCFCPRFVGDAGDVGRTCGGCGKRCWGCWRASVKHVNFARKCCSVRHFTGHHEKRKSKNIY